MSQRNSEYERKERDLYETPAWVTTALRVHMPRAVAKAWEPAAGTGKMSGVLASWCGGVVSSDIEPHPLCYTQEFLSAELRDGCDAIITNPPYQLATEFCEHALRLMEPTNGVVAMLLRTDFDHAKSRTHLFRDNPAFCKKVVLMRRIVWFVEDDGKPKASPSFNHAWYVWDFAHNGPPTIGYGP